MVCFKKPGHAKNCSFAITNVYCKVFVFSSAGITGYRSIYCMAVLNPFVFVTVLAFTFRPTERPDKTEDREERQTFVICFKKYPHQESLELAST